MEIISKREYDIPINDDMCFSCSEYKVRYNEKIWFRIREKRNVFWTDKSYNRCDYFKLEEKFEKIQPGFDKKLLRNKKIKRLL